MLESSKPRAEDPKPAAQRGTEPALVLTALDKRRVKFSQTTTDKVHWEIGGNLFLLLATTGVSCGQ